ncbi:hypothetical protein [Undibacterium griseum]|uniref:Lipoprotein n=1 Tax=Undibacterium griseum TaxID=2762295 RepID=A0ABR6YP25_9BURK|nr:hypothetical protein [Undibacterium griseum]MBC3885648.1 hypothetical protein [Undibacterium griseum]
MTKIFLAFLSAFLLVSCSKNSGVPDVDIHGEIVEVKPAGISNGFHFSASYARMINVNGKKMELLEFLSTYCVGKAREETETCSRGARIAAIDMSNGPVEKLPPGL